MYLVLMAMLALNVSNEVLNAFDILDEGLKKTIKTLEATNKKVLADFDIQYEINPTKVEPWKIKAQKVQEMADEIVEFIQAKKIEILEFSKDNEAYDDNNNIETKLIKSRDNTDAPANIMIGDNNDKAGKELKLMIEKFRAFLVDDIVNTESATLIRSSIESGLNTSPSSHGESDTEIHEWEREHFEHLPLSGVLTIMSGLQINVRNAEAEALKFLYGQIDAGSFKFNQLNATVIPNSNYIIRGNVYKAEVFLAASDTTAFPTIYVTNDPHPYDSTLDNGIYMYTRRPGVKYDSLQVSKNSGKGIYSLPATSLGTKRWGGIIKLSGPTGIITKPFKKSYLVAESSVTVAPTKMNVFYLGVDNPVEVSVAGVQPDKIDISVTNARHVKQGPSSYIIKPIRPGNAFVVVYANIEGQKREMDRKEFRVKTVPDPYAMVNGQKGGAINQSVLLAQIGVVADMGENFDFDLKFTVTEFTVSAVVQGFVREFTSKSNRFTPEQMNLIKNLSRGNNVYIQDIKAIGPDGSTRNLSTIKFKLN